MTVIIWRTAWYQLSATNGVSRSDECAAAAEM